jgi:hypothetical protein
MKPRERRIAAIRNVYKTPPGAPTPEPKVRKLQAFNRVLFENFLGDRIMRDPEFGPTDEQVALLQGAFYRQLDAIDAVIKLMHSDTDDDLAPTTTRGQ